MKYLVPLLFVLAVVLGACAPAPLFVYAPPTAIAPAGAARPSGPVAAAPAAPPAAPTAGAAPQAAATASPAPEAAATARPQATAAVSGTLAAHQWQPAEQLPLDPQLREGKLANGLTYLIRPNAQPKNRAELRLVVNAGSVLEDNDQRGLAHFLEHMLFNGTCRFPKQAIQDFLESNGMRFGADLNAQTTADATTYILRIPLDKPEVMDTALNILVDWASCATLDPAQMDRERGVIQDEYRLREQNAQGRINDKLITELLAGSPYADRLPIGDMNIVQNASVDTLRRFYTTWYRPDLMGVVVAGDFDAGQLEQTVRQKFAAIPAPQDAPPRPTISVPTYTGTHYLVATDPENPDTAVDILSRVPAPAFGTVADYRQGLVDNLFYDMLNKRYAALIQGGSAPFTSADAGRGPIARTAYETIIEARLAETNTVPTLDSLLSEVERVRRYGFTAPELSQAKSALLEGYRSAYEGRATRDSGDVVDELVRHYLTGEDVPGIAVENEIANQLVPQITLAEVNQAVARLAGQDSRLVFVRAPEKPGLTAPTTDTLASTVAAVATKELQPYTAPTVATQLMTTIPEPAAIISRTVMPALNVTELKLANGVRVIMKPTDFSADQVVFSGVSAGGSSLVPDQDVTAARFISQIVAASGVGPFNKNQLDQILAGKTVKVTPAIRELTQRIDGSASPRDLETALQLVYLYVTQPRADAAAAKSTVEAAQTELTNRALAPESTFIDTVNGLLYGDSVRRQTHVPLEDLKALDVAKAFQIYKDRFGDMSGATFVFVGNFDVAQLTELAQRYLGNLPAHGQAAAWADHLPMPQPGAHRQDLYLGNDNRAIAEIVYAGALTDTLDSRTRLGLLTDILDLQLTAQLRLKLGASYSPGVDNAVEHWPHPNYAVAIQFTSDPNLVTPLLAVTYDQVAALRKDGPSADDLAKAKEQERRSLEESLRQNSFWQAALVNYALDSRQDPAQALQAAAAIDKVTAQDIQQAAQEFLRDGQYVQVVLYPASSKPSIGTQTFAPGTGWRPVALLPAQPGPAWTPAGAAGQ